MIRSPDPDPAISIAKQDLHRPCDFLSADGTWKLLLQQAQAVADAADEIDWGISVDSTIVRAHLHAAGARTQTPLGPCAEENDTHHGNPVLTRCWNGA
jgi:hypothetical protein